MKPRADSLKSEVGTKPYTLFCGEGAEVEMEREGDVKRVFLDSGFCQDFGKSSDILGSKFLNFSNTFFAYLRRRDNTIVNCLNTVMLYKSKALLMSIINMPAHNEEKSEQ